MDSTTNTTADQLWTAAQVARFLNVRLPRVYELVAAERLPFIRVGDRQYRFDPTAIKAWLAESTSPPRGGAA